MKEMNNPKEKEIIMTINEQIKEILFSLSCNARNDEYQVMRNHESKDDELINDALEKIMQLIQPKTTSTDIETAGTLTKGNQSIPVSNGDETVRTPSSSEIERLKKTYDETFYNADNGKGIRKFTVRGDSRFVIKDEIWDFFEKYLKGGSDEQNDKSIVLHTTSTDIEELKKEFAQRFGIKLGINDFLSSEAQTEEALRAIDIWNFFAPHLASKSELKKEVVEDIIKLIYKKYQDEVDDESRYTNSGLDLAIFTIKEHLSSDEKGDRNE